MKRLSLTRRVALLFAACTAVVSLIAGVLFNRASEAHFLELDQQVLDGKLVALRSALRGADTLEHLREHEDALRAELAHQQDLALRIRSTDGQRWFDSAPDMPADLPAAPGLQQLQVDGTQYRIYNAPLTQSATHSPQLTLILDITHHQHFLQRMQRLIWLTVGLSALATALLGAWAARRGLQPLRRMSEVARNVSAHSLTQRLPSEQMPEELAELAHAFNAMLARLEDAFARLSAFSADIAHELRTPLSNLLTQTQVVLTQPRPLEEYREALHGNLEELQWMAQLVNDMLYLAKADHGLLMPKRQTLALTQEVETLLEFFALLAEDAQVTLQMEGRATVQGDQGMLRRAISNLLDNALRYTPPGGEVRVTMEEDAQAAWLAVENTGVGIPQTLQPKLFDRFYRADPARHDEHAGLGLAITQSIVRAHGGKIFCESSNGLTRFVIELPKVD